MGAQRGKHWRLRLAANFSFSDHANSKLLLIIGAEMIGARKVSALHEMRIAPNSARD